MNPFGFLLRWLDRRIARVSQEHRQKVEKMMREEAAARVVADNALSAAIERMSRAA